MRYIKMCNTFKGVILVKLIYKTGKKKQKQNWYNYAKDTYFLYKVTNGIKPGLNGLPSQYSRSTYPYKENEVISAEIMKLMIIIKMSIAHHSVMNSFWIFFLQ